MSHFFKSGSQSIGASALASVLPIEYSGLISFRTGWFDLLAVQESSPAPQFKNISFFVFSLLYGPTFTSYMTIGKTIALTVWTFVGKVMSLLLIRYLGLS